MDIKLLPKNYLSSNYIFSILLIALFLIASCKDEDSIDDINVKLNNNETYKYPTVSGDEEGATIITQARHFELSEIIRNAETNYVAVYTYKPISNYVGNDSVELEIRKGSDGASAPTEIKRVIINFIITN